MSQDIEPGEDGDDLKGSDVENNGSNQTEYHKQGSRPGVPPAQQSLHPLPLGGQISHQRLKPPGDAPQPVIPHPHNVRVTGGREGVKLLVQLVRVRVLGARQPGVHVGRVARPPPVVPHPDEEEVEEDGGEDELRVEDEDQEEDVDEDGGDGVPPVAYLVEPPPDRDQPSQNPHDPEEVGLAPPHAPHVGSDIEHVLHHLLPQGRLCTGQPGRHDLGRLVPQAVQLGDGQGMDVVHFREKGLGVHVHHVEQRGAGEPDRQLDLPHLLHPVRVQNQQRVRMGVYPVRFQGGEPDPDLPDPHIPRPAASIAVEVTVIEHPNGYNSTRIKHLPGVLLIPPRGKAVDYGPGTDPLLPVFGDTVGVGLCPSVFGLHRGESMGTQNTQFKNADVRLPQLLCSWPEITAVVGGFVEDMITALKPYPHVNLACEFHFLLIPLHHVFIKIIPLRVHRPMIKPPVHIVQGNGTPSKYLNLVRAHPVLHAQYQRLLEWFGNHKHQILIPHWVKGFGGRNSGLQTLVSRNGLDIHLGVPALIVWHQILGLDHIHPQVPKLGGEVDLGPYAGNAVGPTNGCGVRMPGLGEGLVGLSAQPNSQHELPSNLLPLPVLQPVPLRRQRAVGRDPLGDLVQIEKNPPDEIVLQQILVLHLNLENRSLHPVLGKGKHLVPFRVGFLLKVASRALVVPQPDLDIRVETPGDVLGRQIFSLHNPDIEVLHLLDEVIGAGELIAGHLPTAEVGFGFLKRKVFLRWFLHLLQTLIFPLSWQIKKSTLFVGRDVNLIRKTPIALYRPDGWFWSGDTKGMYSVKGAYRRLIGEATAVSGCSGWSRLWRIPVLSKAKICLWRALRGLLPTIPALISKGISLVNIVFGESNWGMTFSFAHWFQQLFNSLSNRELRLVAGSIWALWKARKMATWEWRVPSPRVIASWAQAVCYEGQGMTVGGCLNSPDLRRNPDQILFVVLLMPLFLFNRVVWRLVV
ncbi:hypothetical protein DM860_005930 [Cuscuta australis]|uniref:Reverse transcriptase zinc-binding domain-containing protein n=1 Tax=Cuscuta australis TaxID=267555 RepID=A0A328DT16_9ASTE|nr:hypothetical protein DM860_005930 [Cuscuta australis]